MFFDHTAFEWHHALVGDNEMLKVCSLLQVVS